VGVDAAAVDVLVAARREGVDFGRTITIGRQALHGCRRQAARHGIAVPAHGWADQLFTALGAEHVESFDISDYEGATVLGDLNEPLATQLRGRYTAVFDGGSLEHVFDVRTGFGNVLRLVAPGGHVILGHPANNQVGHGLYQFSPELVHGVLVAGNGFEVERVMLVERSPWTRSPRRWWEVTDTTDSGLRVEHRSRRPAELYTIARRIGDVPDRLEAPQQADYVEAWQAVRRSRVAGAVDTAPWPLPAVAAELLRRRRFGRAFRRVSAP